jgi:hypothetical protein
MAYTNQDFIDALEAFLISNAGVSSFRHPDGRTVTFDRAQALKELSFWRTKDASATGTMFTRTRIGLVGDA